jgi:ATP-dependent protease ClpP protease subunit
MTPKTDRRWYAFKNATDSEVEIYLYDEIGFWGKGAKEFIAELRQHAGKHVHLRINSPGGEVIEGTAIFNALKRHAAGVTVHIDAMAASMASVIAMAGNPVFMADNALLMIHDPYTFAAGTSEELRKSADLLDTMKKNLVRAYVGKTGLPEKEVEEMMAQETWLGATEAVALGFVDAIEDGVAAAASVTPEKARARFDMLKKIMAEIQTPEIPDPETTTEPTAPVTEPVVESPAAPDPETPVVPEAPAEPTEPVARVDVASITAKLTEAYARIEKAEARAAKAEADLLAVQDTLSKLEKSKGLAAAAVVPAVKPKLKTLSKADFDALTPLAKAEFFRHGGKLSE